MSKANRDKRKRDKHSKGRAKGLREAKAAREAQAKEAAAKGRPTYVRAASPNGKSIQELMIRAGWDPSGYKDCVVIISTRLIDWMDSYNITDKEGKPLGPDHALLVHKSKLHGMIPDKMADLFWSRKMGKRVVKAGPPAPAPVRVKVKPAPERRKRPPRDEEAVK